MPLFSWLNVGGGGNAVEATEKASSLDTLDFLEGDRFVPESENGRGSVSFRGLARFNDLGRSNVKCDADFCPSPFASKPALTRTPFAVGDATTAFLT